MNYLAAVRRPRVSTYVVPSALRKCGTDPDRIMTVILGTQRHAHWQRVHNVSRMDPVRFALMLADERAGRG